MTIGPSSTGSCIETDYDSTISSGLADALRREEEIEFSDGFTELHTRIYEDMLAGGGFGLEENRVAIETVGEIREAEPLGLTGDYHPFLR